MPANIFYFSAIAKPQADGSIWTQGVNYEWNGTEFNLLPMNPVLDLTAAEADNWAHKLAARANTSNYQEYPSNSFDPAMLAVMRTAISKGYTTAEKVVAEFGNLPLSSGYPFLFQTYDLPKTISAADEARVFGNYLNDPLKISDVLLKPSPMVTNSSTLDAGQPWAVPSGQTYEQAIGNAWANSSNPQIAEGAQKLLNSGASGSLFGSASQAYALASTPYTTEIQQGYLAFFLRPADAQGFNYFADALKASGGNLEKIVATFGNSPEYLQTYAGMSTSQRVNALYQNLFGRDAETDGLSYWTDNLDSGRLTLSNAALTILRAALNSDATVVANRIDVAKSFTASMTSSVKIDAYNGLKAAADARALLKTVTADNASVAAAKADMNNTLKTIGTEGSVTRSSAGDVITLSNPSKTDFIAVNASSVGKVDVIHGFRNDVLDVSSFGFSNGIVLKTGTSMQTADSSNFFAGKGVAMATVGTDTYVYVDANKDGSFNAATDVTLKIVGSVVQASEIHF